MRQKALLMCTQILREPTINIIAYTPELRQLGFDLSCDKWGLPMSSPMISTLPKKDLIFCFKYFGDRFLSENSNWEPTIPMSLMMLKLQAATGMDAAAIEQMEQTNLENTAISP